MKHLSRKEIEAIAARVVTAYKKLPELEGQPIYSITRYNTRNHLRGNNKLKYKLYHHPKITAPANRLLTRAIKMP